MATTAMVNRKVVSYAEWLAAIKAFLKKEKEFTRLRDELSKQRRELPWERVGKKYVFDGPTGEESLADLFAGRRQLLATTLCSARAGPKVAPAVLSLRIILTGPFRT